MVKALSFSSSASEADYYNHYAKYDNDVKVNLQQFK